MTFALCMATVGAMSAQKSVVDQAAKLSGKNAQIEDARKLIQDAAANPETQNDPRTYYVGGKIEFDAFDNTFKKQMINPNDASVKPLEMGQQLVNGYNLFLKAMSLDSVPNAKGEIKPKFSKDIASKINGHFNDYFNAGGTFYNEQKFYPEAYEAFMIYGNMPHQAWASKEVKATPDSVANTAFFNAGISAWQGQQLEAAANAFKHARLNNSDNAQNFIYEIACWQNLAGQDSTKVDKAKVEILEIATAGHDKFGLVQPIFFNNLVNSLVLDGQLDAALAKVDEVIAQNPNNAAMYGLRGFVNDRREDDDASVNDYKKAVSFSDTDFETLRNACKKIFKVGTQKWSNIEGATPEQRNAIKADYFQFAKDVAERAKAMNATDSDLNYVIDNIDYALETFFN